MPSQGFITPFWSLTYEVMFYLLAPLLVLAPMTYLASSAGLLLVGMVFPTAVSRLHLPPYLRDFLFNYSFYFAVGIALYTHFERVVRFSARFSKNALVGIAFGCLTVMYAINLVKQGESTYSFLASTAFSVVLIVLFIREQVRIAPFMWVGKFSYTLYITHVASVYLYLALYWLVARPQPPYFVSYALWPPAVVFVVLLGWAQYELIEKRTKQVLSLLRGRVARSRA
jgi:peptidoglycan/LPS O-acetylase OafA/YrhL